MTTATRKPASVRHGICSWVGYLPPDDYALRRGLAQLWVTVETRRGKLTTLYRVQLHHSAGGRLEGITLVKCQDHGPDTNVSYFIDCSFGPVPEEHWHCDCPDAGYRSAQCKHVRSISAALRRIGLL